MVFHKLPAGPVQSIDLARLLGLGLGLARLGREVEVVAPGARFGENWMGLPLAPLSALNRPGRYDAVKTCYHQSIKLLGRCEGPVASRLVRVVDRTSPGRDDSNRAELLACQELVRSRASVVILNNHENRKRWIELYGQTPRAELVPTGCPAEIPCPGPDPYPDKRTRILFLGSIASPDSAGMLNLAARVLAGRARIHFVGRNKTGMYGRFSPLDPAIIDHGEKGEPVIWDYIRRADLGLALAVGPDPFDNDLSKVLYYLRGGLPVLLEKPVLQAGLARELSFGLAFERADPHDFLAKFERLMSGDFRQRREQVMRLCAERFSWERRAEALDGILRGIAAG